jgi:hypothetical protein
VYTQSSTSLPASKFRLQRTDAHGNAASPAEAGRNKTTKMHALGDEERRIPKVQLVVHTLDLAGYPAA